MKVLAGDWKAGTNVIRSSARIEFQISGFKFEKLPFSTIASFDVVTSENRASFFGKVGWGAVGAVALGPIGLLAGVLAGGNKKDRVMAFEFSDGRKALVKGTAKDAEFFAAATFGR